MPASSVREDPDTRAHGAGPTRWKLEQAFIALYPTPADVVDAGLAPLWRVYREAQALAALAQAHRLQLPELNAKGANDRVAA